MSITGKFGLVIAAFAIVVLIGFWLFKSSPPTYFQDGMVEAQGVATVTGNRIKWHPLTISFDGPFAHETDSTPNPFLDYRLQVTFSGPSGQTYNVPGYFAGDGAGNGSGNQWQVRFAADEAGIWTYTASFRSGPDIAVDLSPTAGVAASFDGAGGVFSVAGRDSQAPGFLSQGRLEYVGQHYLKFRDGDYWIKGGANSPENFLGYAGFDNTVDQIGGIDTTGLIDGVHRYDPHIDDWQVGDPNFVGAGASTPSPTPTITPTVAITPTATISPTFTPTPTHTPIPAVDGKGIIGALNYLSSEHVNSIYFLPMNLGGDGRETFPFIAAEKTIYNKTHYDISKLYQWNIVFEHAQEKGIALHLVLAETEEGNRLWLDEGELGVERKLYYRELIARYGYLLALKWNLSEETQFDVEDLRAFAGYIQALDWQQHPIAVHTFTNKTVEYEQIKGDSRFSATAFQYEPDSAGQLVEQWRNKSIAAQRPWVIDMDENNPADEGLTDLNSDDLRKRVLYDVYFSGGNIEWYAGYHDLPLGGDLRLEDFRTRQEMWRNTWYARRFMQENLPFWEMIPADQLLLDEPTAFGGGELFTKPGELYAIYLPETNSTTTLNLTNVSRSFTFRWFNPRTGNFEGGQTTLNGNQNAPIPVPPSDPDEDWVILLEFLALLPTPTPTPTPSPTPTPIAAQITSFTLVNADTDEDIQTLPPTSIFDLSTLPTRNLNIRANLSGAAGSVRFELNANQNYSIANQPPYALAGANGTDYNPWTPTVGRHELRAVPHERQNGQGNIGTSLSVVFIVRDNSGPLDQSIHLPIIMR